MKGNWLDRLVELPDHGQVIITLGQSSIIAVPAIFYIGRRIFSFMTQLPRFYFPGDMGHRWWTMPQNLLKTFAYS